MLPLTQRLVDTVLTFARLPVGARVQLLAELTDLLLQ